MADQPIAYWRLGDSGSTAADSSGYGNTGTLNGSITKGVAGAITNDPDGCMTFDGGGTQYISVPDTAALRLNGNWSLEAWFWVQSFGSGQQHIISKGLGLSSGDGYSLQTNGAGGANNVFFRRDNFQNGSDVLRLQTWYHVGFSYDGTNQAMYFNGFYKGSATLSLATNTVTTVLLIGSGAAADWNGRLDEIALYDSVLPADRFTAHYQAAFAPPAVPSAVTYGGSG